jgi:hypothetical protein
VQLGLEKLPVPGPERVKSTEPEGGEAVPASVSSTTAVHTVPWLMATGLGTQVTVVWVVRRVTRMLVVPKLVA